MTSTIEDLLPDTLTHLPVAKQIGEIDFDNPSILIRAQTGAGKSIVVPAIEAMREKAAGRRPCIVVRQPTKVTVKFTSSGIKHFWEPLGLKVGICTRDEKDFADADVVIISDGSLPAVMAEREVTHFYADEAHWLSMPSAELAMSVAKINNIPLRLMSATVDEKNIMSFLGPGAALYDLDGRCFPVTEHIVQASQDVFDREEKDELYTILTDMLAKFATANESTIVFMPTRKMCEDAAEYFGEDMPTTFVHGGVNPVDAEKWVNKHTGQPFAVFATTAAATGITLDLHNVIICDEIIAGRVVMGREETHTTVVDANTVIQMRGRAGRIRSGDAYLVVAEGTRPCLEDEKWRMWADGKTGGHKLVQPEGIRPPCENSTPYEVILEMASLGIDSHEDVPLISKLNEHEVAEARRWLRRAGCIDDEGKLTKMGKSVHSFPMDARYAHCILTAPSIQSKLTLLAAFSLGLQGTYGMVKVKPARYNRFGEINRIRASKPEFTPWPRNCLIGRSSVLSLAKGLAEFGGVSPANRYQWCDNNHLWAKPFNIAMKDFNEYAGRIVPKGIVAKQALKSLDFHSIASEVHNHLARHPLFVSKELQKGKAKAREYPTFVDSVFSDSFRLDLDEWWVIKWHGIPSTIKPKGGFQFDSLNFAFSEDHQ